MNKRKINALNECIEALKSGYSLDDCLDEHPDFASEFRSLLTIAEAMDEPYIADIPTEVINKNRVRLLTKTRNLKITGVQPYGSILFRVFVLPIIQLKHSLTTIRPTAGKLLIALGITGLFILLSGGLVITSAKSLPGDSLYPIKLAVEDIQFYFTYDINKRHLYEDNYTKQRVDEVKSLLEIGRAQHVSFESIVISKNDTYWNIGGITVEIKPETIIVGGIGERKVIEPGSIVEVEGSTVNKGWVVASEIHIRQYQFIGTVDKIGTSFWIISGIKVAITADSRIEAGIKPADDVLVYVHSEDSGLFAVTINRLAQTEMTPTYTPYPGDPTNDGDETFIDHEEFAANGILAEVNTNYWIMGGNIYFITNMTHIGEEIKVGDSIKIKYLVEENGSFTAVEIERIDQKSVGDGSGPSETPEATNVEDHVTSTIEPIDDDHTQEPSETPKPTETPQPTEAPE